VIEKYEDTPKMSSYIVAFVVSGFKGRVTEEGEVRKFGVYARPEMYDQTEYAFDVGRKLLDAFGNYLNSDYYDNGMKKMDMVALPDFR
jgi:aminopeptidase N